MERTKFEDKVRGVIFGHAIGDAMGLDPRSYQEGILEVIHQGGDADTNAAVAGSVLGAKFGFSGIPQKWVEGLRYRSELEARVDRLLTLI